MTCSNNAACTAPCFFRHQAEVTQKISDWLGSISLTTVAALDLAGRRRLLADFETAQATIVAHKAALLRRIAAGQYGPGGYRASMAWRAVRADIALKARAAASQKY